MRARSRDVEATAPMLLTGGVLREAIRAELARAPESSAAQVRSRILERFPRNTRVVLEEVRAHIHALDVEPTLLESDGVRPPQVDLPADDSMNAVAPPSPRTLPWSDDAAVQRAICSALDLGLAATVRRGSQGDVTLHPPDLSVRSVELEDLAGTRRFCGCTFPDGRRVDAVARGYVAHPDSIRHHPGLTVFLATRPGDPAGRPALWSTDNRALDRKSVV